MNTRPARAGDILRTVEIHEGVTATIKVLPFKDVPLSGTSDTAGEIASVELKLSVSYGVAELMDGEELFGAVVGHGWGPRWSGYRCREAVYRAELLRDALYVAEAALAEITAQVTGFFGARQSMIEAAQARRDRSASTVPVPVGA